MELYSKKKYERTQNRGFKTIEKSKQKQIKGGNTIGSLIPPKTSDEQPLP